MLMVDTLLLLMRADLNTSVRLSLHKKGEEPCRKIYSLAWQFRIQEIFVLQVILIPVK